MTRPILVLALLAGCAADPAAPGEAVGSDARIVSGSYDDIDADVIVVEDQLFDFTGAAAADVGDLTGDGIDDLLIGAPHDDDGIATYTGSARLYAGPIAAGTLTSADAVTTFVGTADYQYVGEDIVPLGDMNADGIDDLGLLVEETLYVWYGPIAAGTLDLTTADASRLLVRSAASAGDLNGDGYSDLATATTTWGEVIVEYGPIVGTEPVTTTIDQRFDGGHDPGSFCVGLTLALDDLTGDGQDDLIIGDHCGDWGLGIALGLVYVFEGPFVGSSSVAADLLTAPVQFRGTTDFEGLGKQMSVGDIDGDGTPDLALAVLGGARVYPGDLAPGLYVTGPMFVEVEGDEAEGWGANVAFVGDLDGSGSDELVLGAIGAGGNDGQAQLLYDPVGTLTVPDPWLGALFDSTAPFLASPQFGDLVAPVGDVNDDGYPDFVIGAFYEGTAYVWFGGVAAAPDFDGDGYDDTVDCNDANDAVHPGAWEDPTNTIDDDCDGQLNELELHVATTPLAAGQAATFTVRGLDPFESARVVVSSSGLGAGPCPAAIGGQCIGVVSPVLLPTTQADATGVAQLTVSLPSTLSGSLAIQAVAIRGVGGTDSLLSDPIEAPVNP